MARITDVTDVTTLSLTDVEDNLGDWERYCREHMLHLSSAEDRERALRVFLESSYAYPMTLDAFRTWALANRPDDVTDVRQAADRRSTAIALATMRRREAQAIADRRALLERIAALEARPAAAVVPWGPSHPDWDRFWTQAAIDAERAGNCGEYDRHAEEMGGPTRWELRNRGINLDAQASATYCVTATLSAVVHVDIVTTDGEPSTYEVERAIRDEVNLGDIGNWSIEDYSVDDVEREEPETYWVNPGA